jgi:hypothetical protein
LKGTGGDDSIVGSARDDVIKGGGGEDTCRAATATT